VVIILKKSFVKGEKMIKTHLNRNVFLPSIRKKIVFLIIFSSIVVLGCTKKKKSPKGVTIKGRCTLLVNKFNKCIPTMLFNRRATPESKKERIKVLIDHCVSKSRNGDDPNLGCLDIVGCKEFEKCLSRMRKKGLTKSHEKMKKIHKHKQNPLKMKVPKMGKQIHMPGMKNEKN
jgi:hypothetical protein